jgi:hypothetical protein
LSDLFVDFWRERQNLLDHVDTETGR